MTRAEIKTVVKQKLDEVSQFDEFQIDSVDFIDGFLDDAARNILLIAPLHLIPPADFSGQATDTDTPATGAGRIKLPTSYLRLYSLKLTEWDGAVTIALPTTHPLYNQQRFTVTRGKPSKPRVFKTYDATLKDCLEYYSVESDHSIDEAFYVEQVDAGTSFPESLVHSLAWQTAGNILQSLGHERSFQYCFAQVEKFIKENSIIL